MASNYCNNLICTNSMCDKHVSSFEEGEVSWEDAEDLSLICGEFEVDDEFDYEDLDFEDDD